MQDAGGVMKTESERGRHMEGAEQLSRRLAWDACYNIRDLGGYPTEDGGQTRWRAIVRADNLCRLTPAGCAALTAYGVRTIIDLRNYFELPRAPHPFAHLTAPDATPIYLHLPLEDETNAEGVAAMRAAQSMAEVYAIIVDYYQTRLTTIVRAVAHAPEGGILLHCHAGKDRTGIVVAVLLSLAGLPAASIAEDYALSDTYLQPLYAELLSQTQDEEERARLLAPWRAQPEWMHATLTRFDQRYGGVRAYLLAASVSEEEIERVRTRLRG
jgi:protein-tyrosine phosphatase